MHRVKVPAIVGLVAAVVLLTRHTPTSFAFDHPVPTGILALSCSAGALLLLEKFYHQGYRELGADNGLLDEALSAGARFAGLSRASALLPLSVRQHQTTLQIIIPILIARVLIFRETFAHPQCLGSTWEPLIPSAVFGWQYWTGRRSQSHQLGADEGNKSLAVRAQLYCFFSTFVIEVGGICALSASSGLQSTYICAVSWRYRLLVPFLHGIGSLLDLVLACSADRLINLRAVQDEETRGVNLLPAAWATFLSAAVLVILSFAYTIIESIVYYFAGWARNWALFPGSLYVWDAIAFSILACAIVVATVLVMIHTGTLSTLIIITFASIVGASIFPNSYTSFHAVSNSEFLVTSLIISGVIAYYRNASSLQRTVNDANVGPSQRTESLLFQGSMLVLLLIQGVSWINNTLLLIERHPIDLIMSQAGKAHEEYVLQAASSKTLEDAVRNYQNRYNRNPPPNFQHWYNFATSKNSLIIDGFDTIYNDLLPFYGLTPQEIRSRTLSVALNTNVGTIMIRNGTIGIGPHVPGTHRWMLDGVSSIIDKFAQWLPDMDLAFNLNDEPRVAVPFEAIQPLRNAGASSASPSQKVKNSFSHDRRQQWDLNSERSPSFVERSLERTFYEYASIGCPPGSPARGKRISDPSKHCSTCMQPHSTNIFLSNWTLAGDVCHQPDMADLHGLYLSPSAFRATHELFPIFSQSKAGGFNDILYPSPWNYIDKVKYDPSDEHPDRSFSEKENMLFWRGGTTEGFSSGRGQWQGMTRQRFIHLANQRDSAKFPLLVSDASSDKKAPLRHALIRTQDIQKHLSADVQLVAQSGPVSIARCDGRDCSDEAVEFKPVATSSDFQSHWQYKYLLDLDGAGFSGRFLPFLQSNSLPFKAGIFREWWDDRVTAWQHFVPLDVRGHAMWATLAYFAGFEGVVDGKKVLASWHEDEAMRIAESGRHWAERVLRKEDMEVYFFRLLLEWGRLTDDARDGIGYDGNAHE